jgi:4-hydroxy-3-polyprenylbenzoate decarboxylase
MSYSSLEECLIDLETHGQLVRVKEEVDPYLEMAAIHLRVHEAQGPALLFENVKGTKYRTASNIFGTVERSQLIFRETLETVQKIIELKNDPLLVFKKFLKNIKPGFAALKGMPLKNPSHKPILDDEIQITDLPLIHHWKNDGGAFITLPQVYTENAEMPGIMHSNLGMYRIQLTGNDYKTNEEAGLHYQIHRGIGVHQTISNKKGIPLKVSVFVGGPPAHTLAAVMPLPEGMSELTFAGILGNRRFRYFYEDGFCISTDADFVITGEVYPNENKPEGPFGDHLGYYSLQHPFPLMHIRKVYAKKNAIWPFTVVGRPPQEDTSFGKLIHAITGNAIQKEIPGLKEVHAVDAAGVHPLLLAIGKERYTPYLKEKRPAEILTIANRILGTGQLSLAKYLFITADETNRLSTSDVEKFLIHIFERIDFTGDIHFQTNTSIDTLDYSGTGLNLGSKVIFAAYGEQKRQLCKKIPDIFQKAEFSRANLVLPGILAIQTSSFRSYAKTKEEIDLLNQKFALEIEKLQDVALIILCDNSNFVSATLENFLWVTFTRSNPSHDIYGVNSFCEYKHWGCKGPLIIDSRIKIHHAPVVEKDSETEKKIERIFNKGGSLHGVLK